MTIGDYVDAFVYGLIGVLESPLTIFAMMCVSIAVTIARWWFNNYNMDRANAYVKTTILSVVGYLLIIFILVAPGPKNIGAWKIIAMTVLGSVFVITGYYFAAILVMFKGDTARNFKLFIADILHSRAHSLETSATQNPKDESLETSAMEMVKQVLEEHKDVVGLLLL